MADKRRRNPHGEQAVRRERAGGTNTEKPLRTDPRKQRQVRESAKDKAEPSSRRQAVQRIDEPKFLVGVIPDLPAGAPSPHDRDVFAVARELAADGGAVVAILFERATNPLGVFGIDRIIQFEAGQRYRPQWRCAVASRVCDQLELRHLLFPDSHEGGDLGRRVAANLGERPATHVWRVEGDHCLRRSAAGREDTKFKTPRIVLVAPEAAELSSDLLYEARVVEFGEVECEETIVDEGAVAVDANDIALQEAAFIVSGGNGVSDWPAVHQLAEALGATLAGSRVACDAGHLERYRQVGASGTVVQPRVYLAIGISGAPQHLQGIVDCEYVISINADPACAMHARADLAVVGDATQVVVSLLRRIEGAPEGVTP